MNLPEAPPQIAVRLTLIRQSFLAGITSLLSQASHSMSTSLGLLFRLAVPLRTQLLFRLVSITNFSQDLHSRIGLIKVRTAAESPHKLDPLESVITLFEGVD